MEIKLREIAMSVAIVLVMIFLGTLIDGKIVQSVLDSNEKYYSATQIVYDENRFEYCLRTNKGNVLIEGPFSAATPITHADVSGEQLYIKVRRERYTQHQRTVYEYDEKGNITGSHIEIYYSWDYHSSDAWYPETVKLYNSVFNFGKFDYPEVLLTGWYNNSPWVGNIRYRYSGYGTNFNGMVIANFSDNTIYNFDKGGGSIPITFFTVEKYIENLEGNVTSSRVLFWIAWMVLTGGIVVGFYYLENRWLD